MQSRNFFSVDERFTKPKSLFSDHEVFDHDTFWDAFARDLQSAHALVLIQSPFLTTRRISTLESPLRDCIRRGVRVCVFVQKQEREPGSDQLWREASLKAACEMLESMGIHVTFRDRAHEKLIVIDENILWDGSLNPLSHKNTSERMTRWIGGDKVREAILMHKLDRCSICGCQPLVGVAPASESILLQLRKAIAEAIIYRRVQLGLSQRELAIRTNVYQRVISQVESANRDVKMTTLLRICVGLELEAQLLPWFLVPAVKEFTDRPKRRQSSKEPPTI